MTPAGLTLRVFAALTVSTFLVAPVCAAPESAPENPPRGEAANRLRHPGPPGLEILSETQRAQVIVLMQELKEQLQAVYAGKAPAEEKDARAREIRETCRNRVNDLLTPGQRAEMEVFREQFRAKFGESDEKISDRIAEQLGLSPEQQEKFRALIAAQADSIRAVINNPSVPMPDKVARIKGIRAETSRLLDGILSPEQRRIHEAIRAETRDRFNRDREKHSGRGLSGRNRDTRGPRQENHSPRE